MKSPLLRAFSVPDVHPRPRKRPPRCTLDCGFKTPESPALRGFEAERCPITGTSLYLVLKSNGLRHSKNSPVKFGFSPKIVPATIVKKLPLQLRPKPLFIAFFSLSHKWLTFAFTGESEYTLGFAQRIAHSGLHAETGGRFGWGWYHYSRSVPHVHQHPRAGYQNGKFCRFWGLVGGAPKERREPSEQRCAYACRCSEGVAAPPGCVIFFAFVEIGIYTSGAHGFPRGRGRGGITTLGALHVLLKRWAAACQKGSFAVF